MADGFMNKLPKDVMIHVILKFPIKSLLRFKCVSTSWYILMQSSAFINLHLNRTTTPDDEIILFMRSFQEEADKFKSIMSFLSTGQDKDNFYHVSPDLDVPYFPTTTFYFFHRMMGPCRGLIVLISSVTTVLFNPATRNYRLVQPSPYGSPVGYHRSIYGFAFGFDMIANEFKIVRLAEVHGERPFLCYTKSEKKVEVYEVSIDSWREVDNVNQHEPYVHSYPCAELFYKGAYHWIGLANEKVILCFDMSTETFRHIKMPYTCHFDDMKDYALVVMKDSLTLICYPPPECEIDPTIDFMEIWVMKEYGVNETWSKKNTITPLAIQSSLAIWKEHILFLQSLTGHLISCDLTSDEVKESDLHGWPRSLRVTIYKESLTLIPKGREHYIEVQ